jgi:hypothetical protein
LLFSKTLAIVFLLASTSLHAATVSFPITWQTHGWIYRYEPIDEHFFLNGGIVATTDVVAIDGKSLDVFFYTGAGFVVNMGWQDDGLVIFDPRDAHYSLIGGFRFEAYDHLLNVEFLHDCFHDIDYYDDKTEIWNVGKLDFYNRNWFPRYRRNEWSQRTGRGLVFDYAYYFSFWYFPHFESVEWVQHQQTFSQASGVRLKLAFLYWRNNAVEFRPSVFLFRDLGGTITHKNELLLYLSHYGRDGTAALFAGPQWDNQQIKPSGDRWIFGLAFYH